MKIEFERSTSNKRVLSIDENLLIQAVKALAFLAVNSSVFLEKTQILKSGLSQKTQEISTFHLPLLKLLLQYRYLLK
jgi:hypothetical protein